MIGSGTWSLADFVVEVGGGFQKPMIGSGTRMVVEESSGFCGQSGRRVSEADDSY
jgi:hypothetical protein